MCVLAVVSSCVRLLEHLSGYPGSPGQGLSGVDSPLCLPAASSGQCDSLPSFVLLTLDTFLADVTSR